MLAGAQLSGRFNAAAVADEGAFLPDGAVAAEYAASSLQAEQTKVLILECTCV